MTSNDNNFESFCLVWLDDNINKSKTKVNTEEQLGKCVSRLKKFEDENKCEQYIRSMPTNNRIVLIVNDHLGKNIIPRIHQLQQVSSIFIYGTNNDTREKWTKDFGKVKRIFKI